MKHLIVAGVPRSGKSTLSRRIAKEFGWQHVCMDAVIAGFEQCFPETGVDTGISVNKGKSSLEILRIISGKIAPFLGPMVIDMYQLLPEDYVRCGLSSTCRILYLLTGDVTPEERFAIQKKFDTPEDYTYDLSDEERMEGCEYLVEQSRLIRGQCEAHGLPVYETAREREQVFQGILARLKEKKEEFL